MFPLSSRASKSHGIDTTVCKFGVRGYFKDHIVANGDNNSIDNGTLGASACPPGLPHNPFPNAITPWSRFIRWLAPPFRYISGRMHPWPQTDSNAWLSWRALIPSREFWCGSKNYGQFASQSIWRDMMYAGFLFHLACYWGFSSPPDPKHGDAEGRRKRRARDAAQRRSDRCSRISTIFEPSHTMSQRIYMFRGS